MNSQDGTARDEMPLGALTRELVRVVQDTMQPERVSVWLRHGEYEAGRAAFRQ